jgi:hypothetical protein
VIRDLLRAAGEGELVAIKSVDDLHTLCGDIVKLTLMRNQIVEPNETVARSVTEYELCNVFAPIGFPSVKSSILVKYSVELGRVDVQYLGGKSCVFCQCSHLLPIFVEDG